MKKLKMSEDSLDYEVGLVSGSLSKSSSGPGSGSLSALFSSTTTAPSSALFQPAPKIMKSAEPKEKPKELPEVKVHKKAQDKPKSAADLSVQSREQSLLAADEEEQTGVKGKKRKAPSQAVDPDLDTDGDRGAEYWVKRRQTLKTNRLKDQEKNHRTVFVGNLPLSATKKTLRTLFKDKGPIESIRFRSLVREDPSMSRRAAAIMRKAHPQKQSINAYVVFKDEEGASRALDRNGLELEQELFIRVDRVTASASHDHKRSIFVGNLPFDVKESSLRRHFSECGDVEAVRLIRDSLSGLGKGFGYVLFTSADSVQLALKLNGSELEGRSIRVKRSVQSDKLKQKTKGKNKTKKNQAHRSTQTSTQTGKGRGRNKAHPSHTGNKAKPDSKPGSKSTFRGEMVDPKKKVKKVKKGLKKQKTKKNKKTVHI